MAQGGGERAGKDAEFEEQMPGDAKLHISGAGWGKTELMIMTRSARDM